MINAKIGGTELYEVLTSKMKCDVLVSWINASM